MTYESLQSAIRNRWQILAAALAIGFVFAVVTILRTHEYNAESAVVMADSTTAQSQNADDAVKFSLQALDLPTLVQSTTLLNRVANDLHFSGDANMLRSHIKAHVALQSNIMPIQFTAVTPDSAMHGANAVADELTKYYRDISTSRYDRLIADLNSQLEERRRSLAQLDMQIAAASAANPYLDAKSGNSSITSEILDLNAKKKALATITQGDIASASVLDNLLSKVAPLAQSELGENDPLLRALREQYAKDDAALTKMRVAYGTTNPGMPELQDLTDKDKRALVAQQKHLKTHSPFASKSYDGILQEKMSADAKVQSDQAQFSAVDQQIQADRFALTNAGSAGVSLSALRRQRDAADAGFVQLSARLTTAISDRAQAASIGSISVVEHATSADASPLSSPKVIFIEMLALALFLGMSVVLLMESNDKRLTSVSRIHTIYQSPVFTTVGSIG